MVRSIIRFLSFLSIGLLICLIALLITLNTFLLTPTMTILINQWIDPDAKVETVTFEAPNHFKLSNVTLSNSTKIKTINAWLTLYPRQFHTIELDALLLNGMTLDSETNRQIPFKKWHISQLSIQNTTITEGEWKIENADIQWRNPRWEEPQRFPYGKVQIHAKQVNWRDETIHNLLIDGEYQKNNSELNGVSFTWNNASVEAQITKSGINNHRWVINYLTVENLSISKKNLSPYLQKRLQQLATHIQHINRMDLLQGQIEWDTLKLNNLELSATNLDVNHSILWGQNDAHISLKADGIEDQGTLWIEPNLKLLLNKKTIDIQDLNIGLSDGDIYLSAVLQPMQARIREFDIIGVKRTIEDTLPAYEQFQSYISQLNQLKIDEFNIRNTQLIQLNQKPYWQLSGINLSLSQAELKQNNLWGLWQGQLTASVNSLSYDKVVATQAVLEMLSDGNRWNMTRFFMPFNIGGYVTATGEWLFGHSGKPWKIDIETDSLPLQLFKQLPIPMDSRGLLDVRLNANGLSGDEAIVRHTLTGSLDASIRQGTMVIPLEQQTVYQPFTLDSIHLDANNGLVNGSSAIVKGPDFDGTVQVGLDLKMPEVEPQLSLTFKDKDEMRYIDMLNPTASLK